MPKPTKVSEENRIFSYEKPIAPLNGNFYADYIFRKSTE